MQHTNNKAKKSYSFSKAKRFSQTNTNYITANYNINRNLNNRGHSIGKGPRSDFTKSFSNAPPPTQYIISGLFNLPKEKGITFGISRDVQHINQYSQQKTKELGYITQGIQRNPGVGNYNCSYCYDPKIQYTMRPKTQSNWLPNFLQEQNLECIPGPGKYDSTDIDQMGQTIYARYRSSRCSKIGKEERFQKISSQENNLGHSSPGPNTYKQTDGLNDSGLYFESKHRGQGKRIICKEPRRSFIDQIYQRKPYDQKFLNHSNRALDSQIKLYESEY
ncbi:unnamed protein product (macronuclear) [Paramecium tetraurelia]|uniref:Uncharacterized protein n=1 Tax=Paramecium tetraurelia TaxID=5888 RepID=A0CD41_PARTE|nr:uncharacterized protein GSPATT00037493001 [Paramecium tetraurelia]CAK68708.1 unnamed protein product [Paramecium tetraurelia]|eukprot:XP_001436105.1 hypothetical protein (macronuclear) [Paramecium tetraurelia strain d4-2]